MYTINSIQTNTKNDQIYHLSFQETNTVELEYSELENKLHGKLF